MFRQNLSAFLVAKVLKLKYSIFIYLCYFLCSCYLIIRLCILGSYYYIKSAKNPGALNMISFLDKIISKAFGDALPLLYIRLLNGAQVGEFQPLVFHINNSYLDGRLRDSIFYRIRLIFAILFFVRMLRMRKKCFCNLSMR
jgi:hypothetical protein